MEFLDYIPLWAFFIGTIVLTLLSVELGFQAGRYRSKSVHEDEAAVGSMVASTVGLLAFMLAFTFGIATSRFDERRAVIVEESNAIGTCYVRADLLEEPFKTDIQNILRQYISSRVHENLNPELSKKLFIQSESLLDKLWAETALVGQKHLNSEMISLFVESTNAVIDDHAKRVTATLHSRVPESVWGALFVIAILSMLGVGYTCGIKGSRSWPAGVMLTVAFSTVMLLVADLDRPWEGFLTTKQDAIIDLGHKIGASTP